MPQIIFNLSDEVYGQLAARNWGWLSSAAIPPPQEIMTSDGKITEIPSAGPNGESKVVTVSFEIKHTFDEEFIQALLNTAGAGQTPLPPPTPEAKAGPGSGPLS